MPRLPVCVAVLVVVCACVKISTAENFEENPKAERYELPGQDKESNFENEAVKLENEIIGNRETRSQTNSLWSRILNRLGKTSETFFQSGGYPSRVGRTNQAYSRMVAPATLWAKFRRNGDSGQVQKKSLSINGALTSLADMLHAEGHRRNEALRQRLMDAGKRR